MFRTLVNRFPKISQNVFESALNEFFDSNDQIEDYLSLLEDKEHRQFTLELSVISASADGLEIRENIALDKLYMIWGIKRNA